MENSLDRVVGRRQTLQAKFDRLSKRERFLFWLTILVIIIASWYQLFWLPFSLSWKSVEHRLSLLGLNQPRLLTEAVQESEEDMAWERWISVMDMEVFVDRWTNTKKGVRLLNFEVEPATLVLHCQEGLGKMGSGSLLRHDFKLVGEGDFISILSYLHTIYTPSMGIQIDRFIYKTTQFPRATMTVHGHFIRLSPTLP